MREALFIKKNRDKWIRYQREPSNDPDEQAERFVELLDDLAYSKTFYPKSKVTQWINSIAVGIYQKIYQHKREKLGRIFRFWTHELPLVVRQHHGKMLFTFLIFIAFISLGIISASSDAYFVKTVLGESYVSMTEDNISRGDPFGVYRDSDKFTMFVHIAFNNIKVAFRAFTFGIFFGLGTLWILFYNGILVGAFEYLFFSKGLGLKSILVIWIHGTIEISSVIIAGTAGFMLGFGILFPGTYSRMESFKRTSKDALKLSISLVPFFIVAALLESYVTYQMSDAFSSNNERGLPIWAGILILAASMLLILWYFVYYPIRVSKSIKTEQGLKISIAR